MKLKLCNFMYIYIHICKYGKHHIRNEFTLQKKVKGRGRKKLIMEILDN